jgi:hypothetical protein
MTAVEWSMGVRDCVLRVLIMWTLSRSVERLNPMHLQEFTFLGKLDGIDERLPYCLESISAWSLACTEVAPDRLSDVILNNEK